MTQTLHSHTNKQKKKGKERSPMLIDWQNHHRKNGYPTKSSLHAQRNSHQNPDDIHHRD
jgi:hypothetical protein